MVLYPVIIGPTTVSFFNVSFMEVGEDAANITGYFTLHPPPSHKGHGADHPFTPGYDNSFQDTATLGSADVPPPWSSGGFAWPIPVVWWIGSGSQNSMTGWSQVFSVSGTMDRKCTKVWPRRYQDDR